MRTLKEKKMSKRLVLVLLIATVLTGGVFAQFSMSAGLGGDFGVAMRSVPKDHGDSPKPLIGGGFNVFFDATYAMFKVGMFIGGNSEEYGPTTVKQTNTYLSFGLLGKYPINLGSSFSLFPMLGFEYNLILSEKTDSTTYKRADMSSHASDLDMFIIQLGLGADIDLTKSIYLRPSLLWGVDLNMNESEKNAKVFKHKLDVGIAFGFKFYG